MCLASGECTCLTVAMTGDLALQGARPVVRAHRHPSLSRSGSVPFSDRAPFLAEARTCNFISADQFLIFPNSGLA